MKEPEKRKRLSKQGHRCAVQELIKKGWRVLGATQEGGHSLGREYEKLSGRLSRCVK